MTTPIENEKKQTMDYQHHTNKATVERMEGKQEKTLKEEENERIIDEEIAHAEEEEEEANIREEGGDPSPMAQQTGPDHSV